LPLQKHELPKAARNRKQSQVQHHDVDRNLLSQDEANKENRGGRADRKICAGKISEVKKKYSLRPTSSLIGLVSPHSNFITGPRTPAASSTRTKRLRVADEVVATCMPREPPDNLQCGNCEKEERIKIGSRESHEECERLWIWENCKTGSQKQSHALFKEWEENRFSTSLPKKSRSLFSPSDASKEKSKPRKANAKSVRKKYATTAAGKNDPPPVETEGEFEVLSPPAIVNTAIRHCRGLTRSEAEPSASVLSFVADSLQNTARFLRQCSTGVVNFVESEYARSTSLLLPYRNVMIERAVNGYGKLILKAIDCVGKATTQISVQCVGCASIAKSTRSIISRCIATQPGSVPATNRRVPAPDGTISYKFAFLSK
jgi:hypothetical protein